MKDNRYGRTSRNGLRLDNWTAQKWDLLKLRFPNLILTQGSPSGATESANTHAGEAAIDFYLGGHNWREVLKYAFEIGLFGWFRPELWKNRKRVWKAHCHLGVRGHPGAHATLKKQQASWTKLRNGLANNGPDAFTWRPANFKKAATYQGPNTRPVDPWYNAALLNMHGDDGAEGTKTFSARLPRMVHDVTDGFPAVIGFCEVQPGQQEKRLHVEMVDAGYVKAAYSHRLALYVRPSVVVRGWSFHEYGKQNKGATEGILRVKLTIKGSKTQVGVTHLDYRKGFDAGRVTQMKQGVNAMLRFGLTSLLPDWKSRTVIMGDLNSEDWVVDQALIPAGFKDSGAGGTIDFILVGAARPLRGASSTPTKSDHPIIRAKLGRYKEKA